jgi:anti-anti-sigma factor
MAQPEPDGRAEASDILEVEARTHRRTASVELRGELDTASVSEVPEMLDGLAPDADGVRPVVLDLLGLTFMDARGLHEPIRQNDFAHQNRHNLAVVRGLKAVQRLFAEEILVLVDDPGDLAADGGYRHAYSRAVEFTLRRTAPGRFALRGESCRRAGRRLVQSSPAAVVRCGTLSVGHGCARFDRLPSRRREEAVRNYSSLAV